MTNHERYHETGQKYAEEVARLTDEITSLKNQVLSRDVFGDAEEDIILVNRYVDDSKALFYVGITAKGEWVNEAGEYSDQSEVPNQLLQDFAVITDPIAQEIFDKGYSYQELLYKILDAGYLPDTPSNGTVDGVLGTVFELLSQYTERNKIRLLSAFRNTLRTY